MSRIGLGMSDGRAFTTYLSPGILNTQLAQQMGFAGCEDGFRQALQKTSRPRMWVQEPPRVAVFRPTHTGKDVPGTNDLAPISCAPGFFPTVL